MAMPSYAGKYGSQTKPIGTETMEAQTYSPKPIESSHNLLGHNPSGHNPSETQHIASQTYRQTKPIGKKPIGWAKPIGRQDLSADKTYRAKPTALQRTNTENLKQIFLFGSCAVTVPIFTVMCL
jgi:hypothetical protein